MFTIHSLMKIVVDVDRLCSSTKTVLEIKFLLLSQVPKYKNLLIHMTMKVLGKIITIKILATATISKLYSLLMLALASNTQINSNDARETKKNALNLYFVSKDKTKRMHELLLHYFFHLDR